MKIAQYEYSEKLAQGSFGVVYKGKNAKTGERVVVKTEPYGVEFSTIRHESTIMNLLYSKSCRSIPPTYWYGIVPETNERILVMPMYQESIEELASKNQGRTSKQYCQNIMRSAIRILGHIHSKYVVHRDIKPANWMINRDELMLIDFGLATFYVDAAETHLPPANPPKTSIIGTPKYASWNIHCGEEYSRRDDLMSVVYVGLFLLRGSSLWSSSEFSSSYDHDKTALSNPLNQWLKTQKTLDKITDISAEEWPELAEYARRVYAITFDETPNYESLEELFSQQKTI